MCGFLWFTYRDEDLLNKLSLSLKERAIDKDYYFFRKNLSFYHAHLSISDLDKDTSQPFVSENCIIWLVWEIYNKQNLLNLCDVQLDESCFTELEVIAICYEKFWKKFIDYVNGEFSIFIFDIKKNSYLFFRDRWGTNNLYYKIHWGNLYFASEIKSLIFETPTLSKAAMIEYLTFQFCISPNTLISDIFSLRPGHILEFHNGKVIIEKFWDFISTNNFETIIQVLDYAVSSRIPHFQKKIFVSLSWGPDSSLILLFLKKYHYGEIVAYSFETEKNKKEIHIARQNTKKLGITHLVINMDDYNFNELESDIYTHEWLVRLPNLWKILKQKYPEYQDIKVEFWWDGKEEMLLSNSHFPYKDIVKKYLYFKRRWLISQHYNINQEFLNKEMFDFNLQMIDKITLRNWLERRLPFTDYELLRFKWYKWYREEAKKYLQKYGLSIIDAEYWYNLGINFSYISDDEFIQLKNIFISQCINHALL